MVWQVKNVGAKFELKENIRIGTGCPTQVNLEWTFRITSNPGFHVQIFNPLGLKRRKSSFTQAVHALIQFTHSLSSRTHAIHAPIHLTHSSTSFTQFTHTVHALIPFTHSDHALTQFTHSRTSFTQFTHSRSSRTQFTHLAHSLPVLRTYSNPKSRGTPSETCIQWNRMESTDFDPYVCNIINTDNNFIIQVKCIFYHYLLTLLWWSKMSRSLGYEDFMKVNVI